MNPHHPLSACSQSDQTQELRAVLSHQLFETDPPDLVALLSHVSWSEQTPRPAVQEVIAPLHRVLKEFQISW
ncbi:MAG: hypothetical protein G8237_00055 [Magnetococcales bacterium]|nr:hypothetical protein [Magnetococcales bacterium]